MCYTKTSKLKIECLNICEKEKVYYYIRDDKLFQIKITTNTVKKIMNTNFKWQSYTKLIIF